MRLWQLLRLRGKSVAGLAAGLDGRIARPFPSNQLNDLQATDADTFFLSSIWMSGYGPAADDSATSCS